MQGAGRCRRNARSWLPTFQFDHIVEITAGFRTDNTRRHGTVCGNLMTRETREMTTWTAHQCLAASLCLTTPPNQSGPRFVAQALTL
jgi:hypothetical protein